MEFYHIHIPVNIVLYNNPSSVRRNPLICMKTTGSLFWEAQLPLFLHSPEISNSHRNVPRVVNSWLCIYLILFQSDQDLGLVHDTKRIMGLACCLRRPAARSRKKPMELFLLVGVGSLGFLMKSKEYHLKYAESFQVSLQDLQPFLPL